MIQEQQDAAWRSLPDGFKKEVSRRYKSWHDSLTFEGECAILDYLFGKHNLTATEEEKPSFKTGDYVRITKYHNAFGIFKRYFDGAPYPCEVRRKGGVINHFKESDIEVNKPLFDIGDKVREITDMEREHKITGYHWDNEEWMWYYDMCEDFRISEIRLIASDKKKQTPTEPERGSNTIPVKTELDDSIWLAYRMEMAKGIAVNLSRKSNDTTAVIKRTMTIVDGIIERLKGGKHE